MQNDDDNAASGSDKEKGESELEDIQEASETQMESRWKVPDATKKKGVKSSENSVSAAAEINIDDTEDGSVTSHDHLNTEITPATPRSTKCPTTERRKRKLPPSPPNQEIEILKSLAKSIEKDEEEDELMIFGRHLVNRLRHIKDPMALFIVQNEIEQSVFRAVMASNQKTATQANPQHIQHDMMQQSFSQPQPYQQSQGYTYDQGQQIDHAQTGPIPETESFTSLLSL